VFLGVDVGSTSMKFVLFVPDGGASPPAELRASFLDPEPVLPASGGELFLLSNERVLGDPGTRVPERLRAWIDALGGGRVLGTVFTGKSGRQIAELLGGSFENDFRSLVRGVVETCPDVRTIFEMGGENAKVIRLEAGAGGGRPRVVDYDTNGDCAAGTGSFIDQQAVRMKIPVEEIGEMVTRVGSAARIAGRCSVFAKSDMIHAQQKGASPEEILKGLCEAVARNFKSSINKGKDPVAKVALVGGLFANRGVVDAIRGAFGFGDADFVLPRGFACMGAAGAALAASRQAPADRKAPDFGRAVSDASRAGAAFPAWEPLKLDNVVFLRDRQAPPPKVEGRPEVYLGIDIGSVSTNFAVVDSDGNLLKEIYVRTQSRPVQVVTEGLRSLQEEFGDALDVRGVGTTGSGRELIGELCGADTVQDEITAHKTGSTFISNRYFGKPVDTILEIGGQDAKYIGLENGIVTDFAMNDACAAGTGSFLEEQAERLGVQIKGEFARIALSSKAPLRMGERCTVFMEQDVNSFLHRGADKADIIAGLAYSVALNYLNRVVRGRKFGDVVYFQGGTAYNDAVAAAFSTVLGKPVIVPPHNGVIGAIGMALLARDKVRATGLKTRFRGFDLSKVEYKRREFACKGCSNYCDMQEIRIEGVSSYWGDKCSDRYRKAVETGAKPVIEDLAALRTGRIDALADDFREGPRGTVGFPRAMYFFEHFPYWKALFEHCGFGVKVSPRTDRAIAREGFERTVAEPCYPIQVAHGHVAALLRAGVDRLFIPNVINAQTSHTHTESHFCPWGQTLPFVIASVPQWEEELKDKLLAPTFRFRDPEKHQVEDLFAVLGPLGVDRKTIRGGLAAALAAQADFARFLQSKGAEAIRAVEAADAHAVVLLGRPYNLYDRDINLDVPAKLRNRYGANVIPIDFLPVDALDIRDINDNMFWNYGRKLIAAARWCNGRPKFHVVYVTNFKCGPDSFVRHFIPPAAGSPHLALQFDGHGNDAGYMTRCEAYLDSKGVLRWWAGQ
jgi:predicted CoA-substrate-specific enzyme activase